MKFNLMLLLFSLSIAVKAQDHLVFNQKLLNCEDKWVAFPMNKDSTYNFGFVYIDNSAGLTLNVEGLFKIDKDGKFLVQKLPNTGALKRRIPPTKILAALIPESKYQELQITALPDWLKIYKSGDNNESGLFRRAFINNQWNEAEKAIYYLEKVKAINPNYPQLDFEFAFAYNVLKQYDKAILVLEDAIIKTPQNCYLYKELVYAEVQGDKLEKVEKTYIKANEICTDNALKNEMAYNIMFKYYQIKNKDKFKYWSSEVKKWSQPNDVALKKVELMQAEMDK